MNPVTYAVLKARHTPIYTVLTGLKNAIAMRVFRTDLAQLGTGNSHRLVSGLSTSQRLYLSHQSLIGSHNCIKYRA